MSNGFYFNPSQNTTNGLTQSEADAYYLIKTGGTDNLNSNVNINAGLNINSNLLTNSLSITPVELSYLDGVSSNIQTQINNIGGGGVSNIGTITTNNQQIASNDTLNTFASKTNTQLINLSTINTNNGITSATNIIGSIDYLQSQINNLPNGSGQGQSYFLTSTTSTVDNQYKTISTIPANGTNEILTSGTITSTTPQQLMGQFISVSPLNITSIPAGIYDFNFYASITNNNLTSYLIVEFYKLSSTLTQTLLFTMTGGDINSAVIIPYNINSTQPAFNINLTDYIMIKIYGKTTSTQNVIINIDYNSNYNYSHFHIPFILKSNHNDLLNIQGGATNDYQHLTTQQLNNINNSASISNNGYLLSNDFITFNNKEPAINKNTAFNQNFETLATNIKMNGTQSLGAALNIARSDHVHPSDTTKENTIIATTFNDYYRGDKTFQPLNKTAIGLSNVDNTSDLNKPISTSTQTALNNKQNSITTGTNQQYLKGDLTLGNQTEFNPPRNGVIYVNGLLGDDSNDGLSLNKAYKTINAALSNQYISSGFSLQINPATYVENVIINAQNLTITCVNGPEIGALCNINGNLTISATSSSVRLIGLTMNNLNHSGACNLYIQNCNINGSFTKSSNSYLSINNMICSNTSAITISGSGNVNIINGSNLGASFTVSNSGAIVVVQNCLSIANIILTAGIISVFQTVIYGKSTAPSFNCCSVSGTGSALYLNNCDLIDVATNNSYIISVAANNYYSLRNVNMNYSGSSLLGINLSRNLYFDNVFSNGQALIDANTTTTLNNKTLNNSILSSNKLLSSTSKFINFIDASDTIVNLSSAQTLLNKNIGNSSIYTSYFDDPILLNYRLKTLTGNFLMFVDSNDTMVNLNSAQLMTNKSFTQPKLSTNEIKASNNNIITIPSATSTLVNTTSIQDLYSKQLFGASLDTTSTAITQLTTDNSTKIATTAYVKNCLSNTIYKNISFSATTSNPFSFGPNSYLEFYNFSDDVAIRTKSTHSTNVNIVYNVCGIYSTLGGGYYATSSSGTLTLAGGNNIKISNGLTPLASIGKGMTFTLVDTTNNYMYRGNIITITASTLSAYYVEQLI